VSTPVPGIGTTTRAEYWGELLKPTVIRQQAGPPAASTAVDKEAKEKEFERAGESKRAELRRLHGNQLTRGKGEAILSNSDPEEDRAAVMLELNASRAAEKEAKHLLERFAGILPDNPRVMKRMINAFAMRQAIGMVKRSAIPSHVLARWTILEQRYPALANLLVVNPEWTQTLAEKVNDKVQEGLPSSLQPFVNSEIIRGVVGEAEKGWPDYPKYARSHKRIGKPARRGDALEP
jgi:hypothetical protein